MSNDGTTVYVWVKNQRSSAKDRERTGLHAIHATDGTLKWIYYTPEMWASVSQNLGAISAGARSENDQTLFVNAQSKMLALDNNVSQPLLNDALVHC